MTDRLFAGIAGALAVTGAAIVCSAGPAAAEEYALPWNGVVGRVFSAATDGPARWTEATVWAPADRDAVLKYTTHNQSFTGYHYLFAHVKNDPALQHSVKVDTWITGFMICKSEAANAECSAWKDLQK
ncbi:hypothetical protein [Nocardia sp. NBC_00416]|uniref:hypothetical protein n=1 Tax=Nocardia sp. NBC_00416 TaxID=2975991 RepID=UPI002E22B811